MQIFLVFSNFKSFGNLWENSYLPCLLLIITLHFTCAEKKIWWNIKTSQFIMALTVCKIFFCSFYVFVNSSNCKNKNSHILVEIFFIFLEKHPRLNDWKTERLNDFQIWKSFSYKFGKDQKTSYQVRQNLVLFCNLVALILD